MGILRLFLAIQVLLAHAPVGFLRAPLHSALAVQCFYAISGFLIQVVIINYVKAGDKNWYWAFYKSRALRIMPLYWLFTVLTAFFFGSAWGSLVKAHDYEGIIVYLFDNIFIFGQDILRLFLYNTRLHEFSLIPPYLINVPPVFDGDTGFACRLTILGVSWSLAVEFWFYLLAPFILLRSNMTLLGIIAVSIVSRLVLGLYGYSTNSFMDGVIINEMGLFLSGALAARFYTAYLKDNENKIIGLLGCVVFICLFKYYHGWIRFPSGGSWSEGILMVPYRYWAIIFVTIISLPFLFHTFGKQKWDRFIGDLSYPVYISHMFIISLVEKLGVQKEWISACVLAVTIITSIVLLYLIERPIDNIRHKITHTA